MSGMPRGLCLALLFVSSSALVLKGPAFQSRDARAMSRKRIKLKNASLDSLSRMSKDGGLKFEKMADEEMGPIGSFGNFALDRVGSIAASPTGIDKNALLADRSIDYDRNVKAALQLVEQDTKILDNVVGTKSQLSGAEFVFLAGGAVTAFASPLLFPGKVVELIIPAIAAFSAAIGFSSEYVGRTAVANGKEIAAVTIQAAAECEIIIAGAERSKAIAPLCVGISASAVAFALLAPAFIEDLATKFGFQVAEEAFLVFPLIAVLAAAVGGLAALETQTACREAINTGARRFASNLDVGRTWKSAAEMVGAKSIGYQGKFKSFVIGTLPAPLLAAILPGDLGFRAIICAAVAAAQAAYYLAVCEYELARAIDSLALKARAAAVSDTYANQGMRSGAILPFTSALGGVCAAGGAAAVEFLPYVEEMHIAPLEVLVAGFFPALGAFFASSASVAKARCEIDAAAARKASETFAESSENYAKDPLGRGGVEPLKAVLEMIKITVKTSVKAGKEQIEVSLYQG
mmetsp:Transcript_70092/g.158491  ORF Transcript_70092/g.158491 Transcript_70092/m.158491 type:complete len:519 (-) Transcript_70092:88-1644(-)